MASIGPDPTIGAPDTASHVPSTSIADGAAPPPPAPQSPQSPTGLVEAPSVYAKLAALQLSVEALLAPRFEGANAAAGNPSVYLHPFDGHTTDRLGSKAALGQNGRPEQSSAAVPPLTRELVQETLWAVGQSLAAHSTSLVPLLSPEPFSALPQDAGSRDRLALLLQEAGADTATASTLARPLVLTTDRAASSSEDPPSAGISLFASSTHLPVPASYPATPAQEPEPDRTDIFDTAALSEFFSLTRSLRSQNKGAEPPSPIRDRAGIASLLAALSNRIAAQANQVGLEHLEEKMTLWPLNGNTQNEAQLSQTLTLAGGMLLVEIEFYVAPTPGSSDWKPVVRIRIAFAPDPSAVPPDPPTAEAGQEAAVGSLKSQLTSPRDRAGVLELPMLFQADMQYVATTLCELGLVPGTTISSEAPSSERADAQRRFARFGANLAILAQLDRTSAEAETDCFALFQRRTEQVSEALVSHGFDRLGIAACLLNFPKPYLTILISPEPWDTVLNLLDCQGSADDVEQKVELTLRLQGKRVITGFHLTPALPTSTAGIHALHKAVLGITSPAPPVALPAPTTQLIDLLAPPRPSGTSTLDFAWDLPVSSSAAAPPAGQSGALVDWVPLPDTDLQGAATRALEMLQAQVALNTLLKAAVYPAVPTTEPTCTVPATEAALDAELDSFLSPLPPQAGRIRTAIQLLPAAVGLQLRVPIFAPIGRGPLAYTATARLVPQGFGWQLSITLGPSGAAEEATGAQPPQEVLTTLEAHLRFPQSDLAAFVRGLLAWATEHVTAQAGP